jgi:Tfp pilus assembly protein PilN
MKDIINLLPNEIKEKRKNQQRLGRVYAVFFTVGFLFIIYFILLGIANQIIQYTSQDIKQQVEVLQKEIAKDKEIEEAATRINEIATDLEEVEKGQILWSTILTELAHATPPGIQIESLSTQTKSPDIKLSGKASSFSNIIQFKNQLESSPYFKDVVFVSSESNKQQNNANNALTYSLTLNLEKKR